MSHKQILFALAKICCNAICAVPDRGRRKQSVTRTGDYPANPVDQSKGKYLMNDTFQKAMANAASEAKSQFETFSKAFDPLFNNEAAIQQGVRYSTRAGQDLGTSSRAVRKVAAEGRVGERSELSPRDVCVCPGAPHFGEAII